MKADRSLPHNVSQLKNSTLIHAPQHAHINGYHFHSHVASRDTPVPRENLSDEEEEESGQEEEDDEMETEIAPRKWQGIEAIFEAYHEYVDGESMSSQLHACIFRSTDYTMLSDHLCERGIRMDIISPLYRLGYRAAGSTQSV